MITIHTTTQGIINLETLADTVYIKSCTALYRGTFLDKESCQKIIEFLSRSIKQFEKDSDQEVAVKKIEKLQTIYSELTKMYNEEDSDKVNVEDELDSATDHIIDAMDILKKNYVR